MKRIYENLKQISVILSWELLVLWCFTRAFMLVLKIRLTCFCRPM